MPLDRRSTDQEVVTIMSRTTLHSSEVPAPAGAYSHGRRIGPFVQISGQVPKNLDGAGIEDQTVQALEQIQAMLAEESLGWQDVLMVRVFLADDEYWDGMDAAFRRVVTEPYPPRTTVSAGLAPKMLVEIDALAVVP
jgi:2-iminobutanoate/2-iminopropanoate deaminase